MPNERRKRCNGKTSKGIFSAEPTSFGMGYTEFYGNLGKQVVLIESTLGPKLTERGREARLTFCGLLVKSSQLRITIVKHLAPSSHRELGRQPYPQEQG